LRTAALVLFAAAGLSACNLVFGVEKQSPLPSGLGGAAAASATTGTGSTGSQRRGYRLQQHQRRGR
jgi:hypothetical protein